MIFNNLFLFHICSFFFLFFTTIATCTYWHPSILLRTMVVMVLQRMVIIYLFMIQHMKLCKFHILNHFAHLSIIDIPSEFIVMVLLPWLFIAMHFKKMTTWKSVHSFYFSSLYYHLLFAITYSIISLSNITTVSFFIFNCTYFLHHILSSITSTQCADASDNLLWCAFLHITSA